VEAVQLVVAQAVEPTIAVPEVSALPKFSPVKVSRVAPVVAPFDVEPDMIGMSYVKAESRVLCKPMHARWSVPWPAGE